MNESKEELLNEIITDNLWAPPSDPTYEQFRAAAKAYQKLKAEGLRIDSKKDVTHILTDNYLGVNFLE